MLANTAAIRVGCLLEIRADVGYRTVEDVDLLFDTIDAEVEKLRPARRHVTVVDWRRCPIMAPAAAEHIGVRIAGTNARTVRSAALASADAATSVLQYARLIREARSDDRKLFFDAEELQTWLAEVLSPAETARLRSFLADPTALGQSLKPPR